MKYIKQYESYNKFKINDYVILDLIKIKGTDPTKYPIDTTGQITNVAYTNDRYPIIVILYDGSKYNVDEEELRLATPEEIEEYNIKKSSNKYNL